MEDSRSHPSARRGRRRRRLIVLAGVALVFLVVIGPWRADNSSYVHTNYQRHTLAALAGSKPLHRVAGPIRVGVAEVDITPPAGHPLAGYSARRPKAYDSIHSRCYARALTIESAGLTVTILTADLLLINARLAHAMLERTGLSAEQVFFTASHTHSGPGGWGEHVLEEVIAGPFDAGYRDHLAADLADVVVRSRSGLHAAEVAVIAAPTTGRQRNRLDPDAPTDDRLLALVFRAVPDSVPLAMLTVFSAHPVIFSHHSHLLSADYPGELVAELRRRTGCPHVLFAAGAVAEATVMRRDDVPEAEQARELGCLLADDFLRNFDAACYEPRPVVATQRLPLELPSLRYPVGADWRLSPLCTGWLTDRHTHLHALRVGPALLVGFPGDFSWQLVRPLADRCAARGLTLVPCSFNGDYKGYFVTASSFLNIAGYETRKMNFFGPWAGEYLADLAGRMAENLAPSSSKE